MSKLSEEQYRERARDLFHCDGDLEFDADCVVSIGEDAGAYVACWKWVPDPMVGEEEEGDDDPDD